MKKYIKQLLFNIFYYKIPKTQYGRCIECDAKHLCGHYVKCTATMNQQYKKRNVDNIIKQ